MGQKDTLHGASDTTPKVDPGEEKQTLKFFFTPREALAGERERLDTANPHAKATTRLPDLAAALRDRFGEGVREVAEYAGETTVVVDRAVIADACRFLREVHGFDHLADMGTLDRFTEDDRFEVFYNLVSITGRKRLRLKVRVDEDDPVVPTITGVFRAASWHEREAWDMMGVRFDGHPDLRRIYMPEDFEYHPARKEFPVLGIPGSLPLPPQETDGALTLDPFARAHGDLPED
ncbi:MAG TPA: NADH-quinone oxidoreductase subunit C [Rubricoccaceae bacterium]|nr:NADH-quinone oxidoreductase subunit C [Rubricoccaceae bacterium]